VVATSWPTGDLCAVVGRGNHDYVVGNTEIFQLQPLCLRHLPLQRGEFLRLKWLGGQGRHERRADREEMILLVRRNEMKAYGSI